MNMKDFFLQQKMSLILTINLVKTNRRLHHQFQRLKTGLMNFGIVT